MVRRKPFESSLDMVYFLTQTAHEYHKLMHDSDTGFLTCTLELCVTLQDEIRKIIEEAV